MKRFNPEIEVIKYLEQSPELLKKLKFPELLEEMRIYAKKLADSDYIIHKETLLMEDLLVKYGDKIDLIEFFKEYRDRRIINDLPEYETPACDQALFEQNWIKFGNIPVYFKKLVNGKEGYMISFHLNFKGDQLFYEKLQMEGKEITPLMNARTYGPITANTITKNLTYEILLLLSADFFYHNLDFKNHLLYVEKYEALSGKNYRG